MSTYTNDIEILKNELVNLPALWDGKTCILELKEADYNWRQMEWWAFYFEYKVRNLLADKFLFPGDRYDNVCFDIKGGINWDLKTKFLNSDSGLIYLNDKKTIDKVIEKDGYYGIVTALLRYDYKHNNCEVETIMFLTIDNKTISRLGVFENRSQNIEKYVFDLDEIEAFKTK